MSSVLEFSSSAVRLSSEIRTWPGVSREALTGGASSGNPFLFHYRLVHPSLISCREMAAPRIIGHLFILLLMSASAVTHVSSSDVDFFHCENLVRNWAASSIRNIVKYDKSALRDLLFFLHVPRTGGRTFFHCFLRKLYRGNQECPRSYDKLRFDPSKSDCRLMVTHDDYSLVSQMQAGKTSVVTILRNPVERVFSAYEFSVEVAARFLIHPNLTSAIRMSMRIRPKARTVSTLDIWPWKYLVPWMREDLFFRREARKKHRRMWTYGGSPYEMEDVVMPLQAFIDDPISHDIIHNGATFQVAGLTNNSWTDEAHEIRSCVRKHPVLGRYVLDVAKGRLDRMLYVGLTEEHKTSAAMFAAAFGDQIFSQSSLGSRLDNSSPQNTSESAYSHPDPYHDGSNSFYNGTDVHKENEEEVPSADDLRSTDGKMSVRKLMKAYEECISSLRKAQSSRRTMSLKIISPVKFSKEARLRAPEKVLERIRSLNDLDLQLYEHARGVFSRHKVRRDGQQVVNSSSVPKKRDGVSTGGVLYGSYLPSRAVCISAAAPTLGVVLYLLVRARRRSFKVKM